MFFIIVFVIIYAVADRLHRRFCPSPNINSNGKYVLVSGCDTGIGLRSAMELDMQGFHVLAGVLLHDNVASLKSKLSLNAIVFRLDITKQEDIDAAFDLVNSKTHSLHALVNNAGIIAHGCIDWTSMGSMRQVMEVNFFGHVAMTKKFLPLLISKRDSRVVNLGSATGFFAFPNTSAYSASKHALSSFSDCLRREMSPWALRVSIIEPGSLRTTMLEGYADNLRKIWHQLPSDVQERWGVEYLDATITLAVNSPFIVHADHPTRVVRAVLHAVSNTEPQIRYRPGWQSKVIFYLLYLSPTWFSDQLLAKAVKFIPRGVRHQLAD